MRYIVRNINLVPRHFDRKTGEFLNSNAVSKILNEHDEMEANERQRKHEKEAGDNGKH